MYGPKFRGYTPQCVNFGLFVMGDNKKHVLLDYLVMKRYDETLD